jgi:hypothetical protein
MQLEKALLDLKKLGRIDPKKQDQYFSNVALKVNTKLGGMNHHVCDPLSFKHCLNSLNTVSQLDERAMRWLTKKKTMMVGIDVTHPGPLSRKGTPPIASVVASVGDSFVQFPASLHIQQTKKEVSDANSLRRSFRTNRCDQPLDAG